jgi:hypothetical protein
VKKKQYSLLSKVKETSERETNNQELPKQCQQSEKT